MFSFEWSSANADRLDGATGREKRELVKAREALPLAFYRPNDRQMEFHLSKARHRLYVGGNRTGKTTAGAVDFILLALGLHPVWSKVMPPPVNLWAVSLDFPASRDVVQDAVRRWAPPGLVSKWSVQDQITYFKTGSTLGYKSIESGWTKFQGVERHGIWWDEEPAQDVRREGFMRVISAGGIEAFTMTPLSGMTWVHDDLWQRRDTDPDVAGVTATLCDNRRNLPLDAIVRACEEYAYDEDQLNIRVFGRFVNFSGLVYKEWDRRLHVIDPFKIPEDWPIYRGIDHGIRHPTVCLWVAVSPDGDLYVVDEHYITGEIPAWHAAVIKEKQKSWPNPLGWTVIDRSTKNIEPDGRNVYTIYVEAGIPCIESDRDEDAGIDVVKEALRPSGALGTPRLKVFSTCRNLIYEFEHFVWDDWSSAKAKADKKPKPSVKDKYNDALDTLRYILMKRPSGKTWVQRGVPLPMRPGFGGVFKRRDGDDASGGRFLGVN